MSDFSSKKVRVIRSLEELNDDLVSQWRQLEDASAEGNVYLSPDFVISSFRFLAPSIAPIIIFISHTNDGLEQMVFVGVFQTKNANVIRPFSCLSSYKSPHTLLSGFLAHNNFIELAFDLFFDFLSGNRKQWKALDLLLHIDGSIQSNVMQGAAKKHGFFWLEVRREVRAILALNKGGKELPANSLSKPLLKSIKKNRRLLGAEGSVEFCFVDSKAKISRSMEDFLSLEHSGWKGEIGTSLLANDNHAKFFREVTLSLSSRGNAFFTEIHLNGRVVASTVNYRSGSYAFAFKLGRDESLRRCSLGVLNEFFYLNPFLRS